MLAEQRAEWLVTAIAPESERQQLASFEARIARLAVLRVTAWHCRRLFA
jgi:hypothetical protein